MYVFVSENQMLDWPDMLSSWNKIIINSLGGDK